MDIDKVGPALIQQLYEKKFISNFADLYKLTMQDFMQLDLIKEKSAFNIYNSIQESKSKPFSRFITALSIKNVGKETGSILAEKSRQAGHSDHLPPPRPRAHRKSGPLHRPV